jgi:hypothetical protein
MFDFKLIIFYSFSFVAPNRGMNWSFSNKVSASSSQFLSFRPTQEDRHRKSGYYHLPHSGSFMPSSVADVYDSTRKAPYSSVQVFVIKTYVNQDPCVFFILRKIALKVSPVL